MKNILITGGPVHAYLDSVKIITNRFKGGLMADLADKLHDKVNVTYLTSKAAVLPGNHDLDKHDKGNIHIVYHNGIDDYMEKVLGMTHNMDAVVLGAAVANLIPKNKIEGKFPSHDYKPGDTIPIDFTIAPRIIDEVKKVNPKCHLFGYKLLSGVDYYELIRAAYGVLLESKAVTVFANDAMDLMHKYAVTKERGVHPLLNDQVPQWSHKSCFIEVDEGYVFGSGAVKCDGDSRDESFVTTARGKKEMAGYAYVKWVDHNERKVYCATTKKASLNAPLFHFIFNNFSDVKQILHFHHQRDDLITLDYATPGTDMDTARVTSNPSFNIKGHGCILSYNRVGDLLK